MNTIGLVGPRMVASLLGFNLGVEIGQVLFVMLWIGGIRLLRQVTAEGLHPLYTNFPLGFRWPQACSGFSSGCPPF